MAQEGECKPSGTKKMSSTLMRVYIVLLVISIVTTIIGVFASDLLEISVSVIVIAVILATMLYDKKTVHIPPMMLILIVTCTTLRTIGKIISIESTILTFASNFFLGMILSLCGFICAYVALGKIPGFSDEKPALVSLEAFTFGVAIYSIGVMICRYIDEIINVTDFDLLFDGMLAVTLGCLFISLYFIIEKKTLFKHTVFNFMYVNSDVLGVCQESDILEVRTVIAKGESDTAEFKSTLRTNLQTGEKDKRMEKAVLKTIVAFLNSNGGTLLIGVNDDGDIIGIDEESFDNRDKMNLHMTNLISSQIGDEFIPYIRFKLVSFDEKAVMMVSCKKCPQPVFLRDGKAEIYYVRSGPSSVELAGSDMLKYIASSQKLTKLKVPVALPQAFDKEEQT